MKYFIVAVLLIALMVALAGVANAQIVPGDFNGIVYPNNIYMPLVVGG